jgi:hypothetical protein
MPNTFYHGFPYSPCLVPTSDGLGNGEMFTVARLMFKHTPDGPLIFIAPPNSQFSGWVIGMFDRDETEKLFPAGSVLPVTVLSY